MHTNKCYILLQIRIFFTDIALLYCENIQFLFHERFVFYNICINLYFFKTYDSTYGHENPFSRNHSDSNSPILIWHVESLFVYQF